MCIMMHMAETLCSRSRSSLQVTAVPTVSEQNSFAKQAEHVDSWLSMDMDGDTCSQSYSSQSTNATDDRDDFSIASSDSEKSHATQSDELLSASIASTQSKSVSFNEAVEIIEFIVDVRESTEDDASLIMDRDACGTTPDDEKDLQEDLEHWHCVDMFKTHRSVTPRGCGKAVYFAPPAASKLWRRRSSKQSVGECL
jgi:predicted HTH domain antitoxin